MKVINFPTDHEPDGSRIDHLEFQLRQLEEEVVELSKLVNRILIGLKASGKKPK